MKTATEKTTKTQAMKRQFEGEVVSVAEDKTIRVRVNTTKMHPKYRKQYVVSKKYAVHDEKNEAVVGNIVRFQECRPLSKTKRWRLMSIVA